MTTVFSPSLQEVPSSVSLLLPFKQLVLPLHMRLSMQPPPSPFSSLRFLFGYGRILFGRIPHRPACNETHQTVWIPHFSRYGQNVEQALDFNSRSFEEIQQILWYSRLPKNNIRNIFCIFSRRSHPQKSTPVLFLTLRYGYICCVYCFRIFRKAKHQYQSQ